MKFILGKKLPMTQIWENDKVSAVTPVQAGPCVITQVKTVATDKYSALQLAFGVRKEKNIKKPQLGHFKKAGVAPMHVREFRTESDSSANVGDQISVATFSAGDVIDVTGTSKGRGFQGVVKRHHFQGGRKSHGNKDQLRMPGSVGAKGPAHIFKGTRMGGRMGNERVTLTNLTIASVDTDNNIIYVRGAVPGAADGLLLIKGKGELVVETAKAEKVETPVAEAPVVEETPVVETAIEIPVEEPKAEEVPVEENK
ncbi:MAG: 50S ribosomal protein L3 [Bacillota bacterium]